MTIMRLFFLLIDDVMVAGDHESDEFYPFRIVRSFIHGLFPSSNMRERKCLIFSISLWRPICDLSYFNYLLNNSFDNCSLARVNTERKQCQSTAIQSHLL